MQGNAALTATVIGKTDSAGGDAANLRLSERRANTVRTAVWHTGTIPAQRIETRWTGERPWGGRRCATLPMREIAGSLSGSLGNTARFIFGRHDLPGSPLGTFRG